MIKNVPTTAPVTRNVWPRALLAPLLLLLLVFGAAGRLDYWQGWVYVGITLFFVAATVVVLGINNPLIAERLQPGAGMKEWDKLFFRISTPLNLLLVVIAALDGGRFGWSGSLPLWLYLGAVIIYAAGHALFLWSKAANHFFSTVVRIQTERGHRVCSTGPYRIVRHPGYVGALAYGLATPLLLGSWWGLLPALLSTGLLIWRTAKEDKTLQLELPGYIEYVRKTPYRLLPGIW
jgi:protein-S-isoprenylcysteine O-methyltransferase Ste14